MKSIRWGLLVSTALWPCAALAQDDVIQLETIEIVNITPLLGSGVDPEKVPAGVRTLNSADIARSGVPSALDTLQSQIGGVNLNQAQNNPFQPNFTYRGFEASPLAGNAQGIAVYVNGARFNAAFGDTMNWDLLPDVAIGQMNLEGANPVFGLNALGGSLAVQMKDGFTWQGVEASVYGGSFGRIASNFQFGRDFGGMAVYAAANVLRESGWRQFSPSQLVQGFADFGWQRDGTEIHLDVIGASNNLTGNGTSPVELIAVDPTAVFTHPDTTINQYGRLNLRGTHDITDNVSIQANAYIGYLNKRTLNGDAAEIEPCDFDDDILCNEDGEILTDTDGNPIANYITDGPYEDTVFEDDFDEGGPYAVLNRTNTRTLSYGTAAQLTSRHELFGVPNLFVFGASFDGGSTMFDANTEVGGLGIDRGFVPGGNNSILDTDDIAPVSIAAQSAYTGVFFTNTIDITDRWDVTLAGRFNMANLAIADQLGNDLTGTRSFLRFNPAVGTTYRLADWVSFYAGYSESNRAPTPAEITCATAADTCSLTNFFVGDDQGGAMSADLTGNLRQVVSRTIEAGFRGNTTTDNGLDITWRLGGFHAQNTDDILFVASPVIGRGFFTNVPGSVRQGIEAGVRVEKGRWSGFIDYSFINATFSAPVTLSSPRNPFADADGNIQVAAGDSLPGIPQHQVKFGADFDVTQRWTVGFDGRAASGMYFFGDESNQNATTRPYVVFDLNTTVKVHKNFELFASIENVLNTQYETFGIFSEVDEVPLTEVPGASNPRAVSLGAPFAVFGGARIKF